ncbi:hypothetical protein D1B31_11500 [Neobacillus notoginsengisoli]|uniref:Uncharacterized protein n=1 Tax=Neobacillus notoginsengisoli TaxID=1578198 RepID=A0A417YUE3_9BACI|nr:hypothetical protein D1B31_11500 [Neobacillus notoginsengisoli]
MRINPTGIPPFLKGTNHSFKSPACAKIWLKNSGYGKLVLRNKSASSGKPEDVFSRGVYVWKK